MNAKDKFLNIIDAGHSFSDKEHKLKQKVQFIMGVVALSIVITMFGGTIRFLKDDYFIAIVDYTYIAIAFWMIYIVRKDKYSITNVSYVFNIIIYIFVVIVSIKGQYNARLILWFVFIASSFFLLDRKYLLLSFLIVIATNITIFNFTNSYDMYTSNNMFLYLMLLFIVFILFFTYEKQQINNFKRFEESNIHLQKLVQERTRELSQNLEELKTTQEQLIESEKMASLGTLVAGVAHEINTPVGVALTGITYLEDELKHLKKIYEDGSISEEDFYSFIEHSNEINQSIQINIKRAVELVRSFKQVAVDQSSQEIREIIAKEYLEDILLSLGSRFKQTKHKVKLHVDKDLKIVVNPGIFSQILTNLIMNSLIHGFKTKDEGTIDIEIKTEDKKTVVIYKDDGVGITKEVKRHIFDPFFTTNRDDGGSGLGMNIVYNLVTMNLKGTIKVMDDVDCGVGFRVVMKNLPNTIKS